MEHFEPNVLLDFFYIIIAIFIAIYNYFRMKNGKSGTGYVFFVIFILLFSLYYRPINSDFWSGILSYQTGTDAYVLHMEPFYYWLISVIPNNYLLWRTAIWLPAAIIIAITYKMMSVSSSNLTTFFFIFALTQTFYYLRNILGFSILCLAIVYLCSHKKDKAKIFYWIIFFGFAFISWLLHKSMPVYISLALVALLLPFNKNYIRIAILIIPILSFFVTDVASEMIGFENIWYVGNGQEYLDAENTFKMNWKGIVSAAIQNAPVAYFYYIAFSKPLPQTNSNFIYYKVFLLFSFFILLLSITFIGIGAEVLRLRFYYTSMFPFAFAVSLYFKEYLNSKQCKNFMYLIAANYSWQLLLIVVLGEH